jgi:glycosyltransferase involved in cell wall biosynthesis
VNTENLKILIIGSVFPEPDSSAAGSRMMQLIYLFLEQNWTVTFASPASDSDFMFDLKSIGVATKHIEINNSSFDDFAKNLNPNIVIFDRFMIEEQFGWRIAENCPSSLRILDTEDLHCLRSARHLAFKENRVFENSDLFSDTAKREIASILRCDLSLIISEFEMNLLQNVFKISDSLLMYLPFLLDTIDEKVIAEWPLFEHRTDFVFIGNFYHEPNWNAVLFLKENIFPAIKKMMPAAKIKIYGAYTSQKVLQLHNSKDGFLIIGRAENSKNVIQTAKVLLAPIRFGAGIKGKLVDAMFCGTPTVTTAIGAEGIEMETKWNGFIENEAESFAKAAVLLYTSKSIWESSQKKGIEIFNSRYLKNNYDDIFKNVISDLLHNLAAHRQENFMGALLQFHHSMGTKYMSKWIEAKNKN